MSRTKNPPMTQQEKFRRLTTMPVPKLVLSLAAPTILTMLISSLYNMADTYFVGQIGTSATAAVGVIFPVMSILQAIGFTFGHGAGNYISRHLGMQDTDNASKMAATGFFSAMGVGVLVTLVGLLVLKPLVYLLGATETIAPYAIEYARIILLGGCFFASSLMLNNLLRFQGSAFYGMIGMVSGAVLNIGLDSLFIFVFDMGIAGAALATILSQFTSFCLLLVGCTKGGNISIHIRNFTFKWAMYKEILRGGLPSLFRQSLGSVATVCLNTAARVYGDPAIAAMSVVSKVMMFAFSAVLGLGQGFQPVCGFNYGAKLYARVRKAFWFCFTLGFAILLVCALVGSVFAPQVIAFFRADDAEVIRVGATALRLQCILFPTVVFVTVTNMMLQTMGKAGAASLLAISRNGLFFLPAIFLLPHWFGLLGVQLAQPVADLFGLLLAIPLAMTTLRRMKQEEAANPDTEPIATAPTPDPATPTHTEE